MSLKKNVVANTIGKGWVIIMSLAFIPLYIYYLGIEGYALIAIFQLLASWLSMLDGGMTPTISREMSRYNSGIRSKQSTQNLLRTFEIIAIVIGIGVFISIWMGADFLAKNWLETSQLSNDFISYSFVVMGFIISTNFLSSIYRNVLVGLEKQVILNVFESVVATLQGLGAVIVLSVVSPTVDVFFTWQLIVFSVSTIGLMFIVYNKLGRETLWAKFSLDEMKSIWRFSLSTMSISLLGLVASQSDKLILSKLLSLTEFGYYAFASTVANKIRVIAHPIDLATYPRMTSLYANGSFEELKKLYHISSQISNTLLVGIAVVLILFGGEILNLWTQNKELSENVFSVMWLLVIGSVLNAFMHTPYYLQMAAGYTSLLLKANMILALLVPIAVFYGTLKYGVKGAAITWVLINIYYLIFIVHFMHKKILPNEKWKWYWNSIAFPIFIAFLIGWVLKQWVVFGDDFIINVTLIMVVSLVIIVSSMLTSPYIKEILRSKIVKLMGES